MSTDKSKGQAGKPGELIKKTAGAKQGQVIEPNPPVEQEPPIDPQPPVEQEPPIDPQPPVEDLDEEILEAVIDSVEADTLKKQMEKAVLACIVGGTKPDYVTEDLNCFEGKNFAFANEHCLKNEIFLYKVVYGTDGEPVDLDKMGE